MLKRLAATATLVVLTPALGAVAQQDPTNPDAQRQQEQQDQQGQQDKEMKSPEAVLNKLNAANYAEIMVATMAKLKTDSDEVRTFADQIVEEHDQLNQDIKELAKQQDIKLKDPLKDVGDHHAKSQPGAAATPSTPGTEEHAADKDKDAVRKHKQEMERLSSLSGEQFDREFTSMMAKEHEELLDRLAQAEREIEDEAVKKLIQDATPKLRKHQQRAEELSGQLSGTPVAQAETD